MEDVTRVETPEGGLRVELRRYLAGIPHSHRRALTPEERRAIRRIIVPYILIGVFFIGLSAGVFVLSVAKSAVFFAYLMGALLLTVPGWCAFWTWPFVQALRADALDVYIGPLRRLTGFDAAHDHYLRRPEVEAWVDRYVELHAVGDGERIWRLEGVENGEALSEVRSVRVALVPDQDERGERPLTPEEKREISLRARDLRRWPPILAAVAAALFVGWFLSGAGSDVGSDIPRWVGLAGGLVIFARYTLPLLSRWRFGGQLRRDQRTGTVRDGRLASGTPWVVDGEPARWRTGWIRGGSEYWLSRERADRLEAKAAGPSAAPQAVAPATTAPVKEDEPGPRVRS
jgi:hypothetical protein